MEANKPAYQEAKENFHAFVDSLIQQLAVFDARLIDVQAKDCTFRINRDIRFSKDKRPYKTNFAAFITPNGKKSMNLAGYYIHLEPGACFAAVGIYMPEPNLLAAIRQEIDYRLNDWKKILRQASFVKHFEKGLDQEQILSRPPKGYEADNPAIEWLKLKSFTASSPLRDDLFSDKQAAKKIAAVFQAAYPLVMFLNEAAY